MVIYLLYVKLLETIHINRLPDGRHLFLLNKAEKSPQFVANLTVWEDAPSLERFVWGTIHKQFYERRAEWFALLGDQHFVMWWVPAGHRPTLDEALERLEHLKANGPGERAFGWAQLADADQWRGNGCVAVAAG